MMGQTPVTHVLEHLKCTFLSSSRGLPLAKIGAMFLAYRNHITHVLFWYN